MHLLVSLLTAAVTVATSTVQAIRIIQSNDDGWAELYVRSFHDALMKAGHDVVLSAPAENKSGTSSLDIEPLPRLRKCQYSSCPSNSASPLGRNSSAPRLNWVNSFPVTAMRYGIDTLGPENHWAGAPPDLAVSGPNVGSNLWLQVPFSGTVGVALYASKNAGIPAIAFSGTSGGPLPWNTYPIPLRSRIYADLATKLVDRIVVGGAAGGKGKGKPYLPKNVWLNVNFPEVAEGEGGKCDSVEKFKWVLSRINPGFGSGNDVRICGDTTEGRLPTETEVLKRAEEGEGCFIAVSVGDANDKTTADAEKQRAVLERLGDGFLSCLP